MTRYTNNSTGAGAKQGYARGDYSRMHSPPSLGSYGFRMEPLQYETGKCPRCGYNRSNNFGGYR